MSVRNKYRAKAIETPDGRFHSTGEYRRYCELKLLQSAGVISDLKRQVKYPLTINGNPIVIRSDGYPNGRKCVYTADFTYVQNNLPVVVDWKGYDTSESRLRRAVCEAIYGFRIKVESAKRKPS